LWPDKKSAASVGLSPGEQSFVSHRPAARNGHAAGDHPKAIEMYVTKR
jgi:hypothetical protein